MRPKTLLANLDGLQEIMKIMEDEYAKVCDAPLDPIIAIEQINDMINELVTRIDDLIELTEEYNQLNRHGYPTDWRLSLADKLSNVMATYTSNENTHQLKNVIIINILGDIHLHFN